MKLRVITLLIKTLAQFIVSILEQIKLRLRIVMYLSYMWIDQLPQKSTTCFLLSVSIVIIKHRLADIIHISARRQKYRKVRAPRTLFTVLWVYNNYYKLINNFTVNKTFNNRITYLISGRSRIFTIFFNR